MSHILSVDSLPAPKFRYSPAIAAGPFVKTAGMIGLEKDTGELVSGGAQSQTAQILENVRLMMIENSLQLSDMISATIYTTEFEKFPSINVVWDKFFPIDCPLPTRTSIGVSALPLGATVEIEFLFYRGQSSGDASGGCNQNGNLDD